MEPNVKIIAGGLALFLLGGLSVYFVTSRPDAAAPLSASSVQAAPIAYSATTSATEANTSVSTTESFYEAAEARREQLLINKEEADRVAKLKSIKERSVECKFWKQQQKTSSAAAKIDAKIAEHCHLPNTTENSELSVNGELSASSTGSL